MADIESTQRYKDFIGEESVVRKVLYSQKNIYIPKPRDKFHPNDGFMYRDGDLIGVCEIKSREFLDLNGRTPITIQWLANSNEGALVEAKKLNSLFDCARENKISAYFITHIPADGVIVIWKMKDSFGYHVADYSVAPIRNHVDCNPDSRMKDKLNALVPCRDSTGRAQCAFLWY